jgi:hypothetical protein
MSHASSCPLPAVHPAPYSMPSLPFQHQKKHEIRPHASYVEAGWLYGEVMETDWDSEISSLFPVEGWANNQLTHFEGESLDEHLYRLHKVREVLLTHFRSMTLEDWRKPRVLEEYDVTPEWVVYHLVEHESHHRGQIFQLLRELRK